MHEPVTKPHTRPITTSKSSKGKKKWGRLHIHATNPSLIDNFLLLFWCSQGSLMSPVLPYWGRGCTKYKLTQVNPKIALVFSPLDFKACPLLSAAPPAPVVTAVVTDGAAWVVCHGQAISQTEINRISYGVRQAGEKKTELMNTPWPYQSPTWGKATVYK